METGGYPVLKSFLVGSFSGTFSTILFQPLDLIKTRLQNRVNNHVGYQRNSMVTTIVSIVQKENIFGLWRGITPSMTRVIPGVGLYFSTLYWLKSSLALREPLTPFQAITLGITARTISGVILIPITVIKTRYESGVYKYNSIREALRLIHKYEGIKGLSSGLVPTLLRDAPYSGLYLMFYTELKKLTSNQFPRYGDLLTIHFGCGVTAGILASLITHPADVIKTKMQLYPDKYKNLRSTFFFMYSKFGIFGYFEGIVPRMIRRTLMTAMAWTVYEQITLSVGLA
ncbi:PREDICTED: solute carrier family 25 member 38-like isoform X2 [Ceratosolen solmsi marchali]|uniref:Mitochondrial glycine transporter n=1 Tax=Ceratosolen solmsi marchali TaxID=326594 RepID=A0AAJ7DV97_9HYME|nr:PREDICTED: solute carrier family 25 member 38-like isoform X2 [Ceratosolen solmsi marchali]